ncbi:MAG: sensor histidine kinase [Chlorobi bacterium]|nr:sensor histidine kinase [Chlorobiota bacterium]
MFKVRFHILLIITFLFALSASAQTTVQKQKTIDSLEHILNSSFNTSISNKEIILICDSLSQLYLKTNRNKAIEFAIRSLKSAEKEKDINLEIKPLKNLGEVYFRLDDYEKSIEYYTRLAKIYEQQNKELETAHVYSHLGAANTQWSKYDIAKSYYDKSINICKKHQDFAGIAMCLSGLANIMTHWGDYELALSQYLEALKFWEEMGNLTGIAQSYNNIGMLYQEIGEYEKANDYYKKGLAIFEELNDTWSIVNMILHIGDIYLKTEDYDKALEYYFKALEIEKGIHNKKLKAIAISNIGEAYNKKGEFLKALDYQNKALKLKEELGDKKRLSITYSELGIIYNNLGDYEKSIDFLKKGLELALEINSNYQINTSYKYLSDVYSSAGDYENAFYCFNKYTEGSEQVNSMENKKIIGQLQSQYQLEKKEKENQILRNSEQYNEAQIRIQWLIIGLVSIILIASFILAFVFKRREQQKKKLNVQLALKNKEIEQQGENVQKLNAELQEANATKDKFFSIVAHDLKNPFNSLILLTEMLLDDIDTLTKEEIVEYLEKIKTSSENTYMLLQNLLDWASSQTGKHKVHPEKIDEKSLALEMLSLLLPNAENKEISMRSDIPANSYSFADKNMISTVLLNLLSNAIKFTPRKGKINISFINKKSSHVFVVSDNGVGISEKDRKNLFRIDKKIQNKGTEKEPGTGLGLLLCKEFVEKNNGHIWVESELGKGSKFFFSIPVK